MMNVYRWTVMLFAAIGFFQTFLLAETDLKKLEEGDRFMKELQTAAEKQGRIIINKSDSVFAQKINESQNFVEEGKYVEAVNILETLLNDRMESDWKGMIEKRRDILMKWQNPQGIDLKTYQEFYLETGPQWFHKRLRPITNLWKLRIGSEVDRYFLICALFEKCEDPKGRMIFLEAIPNLDSVPKDRASEALLIVANSLHEKHDVNAEAYWQRIVRDYPKTPASYKALFNLGILTQSRGEYTKAIELFQSLINANPNDQEVGAHIMEPYRNYRARAQRQISECYFDQKAYEAALQACLTGRNKYPYETWCGNERSQRHYESLFFQALCLEGLHKYSAAMSCYVDAVLLSWGYFDIDASRRIADLYEAAGQIQDLQNIMAEVEAKQIVHAKKAYGERWSSKIEGETRRHLSTAAVRGLLELRAKAKEGKREELIPLLKNEGTVARPYESYARNGNWKGTESARLLALTPEKSVPELIKSASTVTNRSDGHEIWIAYALGRCGTPEALDWLKGQTSSEEGIWDSMSLVYSISLAGEKGEQILQEFEKTASGNLKISLEHYRNGRLIEKEKDRFPPIPAKLKLPASLEELERFRPESNSPDPK
jgi:tetratricopeptide (TPR) repeat protein